MTERSVKSRLLPALLSVIALAVIFSIPPYTPTDWGDSLRPAAVTHSDWQATPVAPGEPSAWRYSAVGK